MRNFISHPVYGIFVRVAKPKTGHDHSQPNSHECLPYNLLIFATTLSSFSTSDENIPLF